MDSEYYTTLELERNATKEDIRKQYKVLMKKYHPDKNLDKKAEAEAKCKDIMEAYEILSDPQKRQLYDEHGKDGLEDHGVNFQDIINNMYSKRQKVYLNINI